MAPIKHVAHSHKPHVEPAYVQIFIQQCLPAAREVKGKWRVPISVLIAQAATESSWGRNAPGNAYFGVKGKAADGETTNFATTEYTPDGKRYSIQANFRGYKDFAEAADDYGRVLATEPRFKAAFLHTDNSTRFVEELKKANYASGPDYVKTVTGIIKKHHLDDYDK